MLKRKIGFIGGGNMAEAMAGALIRAGVSAAANLMISDVSPERLDYLKKAYGVSTVTNNRDVFLNNDVVILAVKPQVIDAVLTPLAKLAAESSGSAARKLIISIAAGVPIRKIENRLYAGLDGPAAGRLPLIRVMPNTPALVMTGMSGMSGNAHVTAEDKTVAMTILEAIGKVLEFKEEDLDAVTAVSGSGPAYLFYLVEAMIAAGVSLGLSQAEASTLTLQTVKGAVKLLEETGESPETLRRKVTSPGGTTEAALKVMETQKMKDHLIAALTAACRRAHELCG